jgi:hypothetical protein
MVSSEIHGSILEVRGDPTFQVFTEPPAARARLEAQGA